jgi:hypothetical protein
MHSSHSRNRRQRTSNGDVNETVLDSRHTSTDAYNRRQYTHGSDNYRPVVSSARVSYTRETSSSRHHDEWRPVDQPYPSHDRYNYSHSNDTYPNRSSRDEYEASESRDSEGWNGSRQSGDTRYAADDRGWGQRYDHGSSASYTESASWTAAASYESRVLNHDQWPAEDIRSGPSNERSQVRSEVEERRRDRESGWRKHGRKDGRKDSGKGDPSTWRSDSGWQSRRSGNQSQGGTEPTGQNNGNHDEHRPPADDRSWEPASTWQSQKRSGIQSQSNQKEFRNNQANKNSKGRRRNRSNKQEPQQQQQQRRDWRSDDDSLNKYDCNMLFFLYY